jgi:hypothetical protein
MRLPGGGEILASMRAKGGSSVSRDTSALGEEGESIAKAMMEGMPIGALAGYGIMTASQLDGLIAMLDAKLGHD